MHSDWQQFLLQHGATIETGRVTGFAHPLEERRAALDGTVLCDLSHLGLILVSGDEAVTFLHGQVTNDVLSLPADRVQLNGYCSPKGRLLATFLLWQARQGLLLQMPAALVEPIRKRLAMFVLRAKVKIEDASTQWIRIGIGGAQAAAAVQAVFGNCPQHDWQTWHGEHLGQGARLIRWPGRRLEIICAPDAAAGIWTALATHATPTGHATWDWLDIQSGIPTVTPTTQEAFIPQMINYELLGGVSFRKGCYPGQEIVARTQYRGILKRRMALAHAAGTGVPLAGSPVYSAAFGDQACGEIVNVAPAPEGGYDVLVVAQLDALHADTLRLGGPDGEPLSITRLLHPEQTPSDTSTAA